MTHDRGRVKEEIGGKSLPRKRGGIEMTVNVS